MRLSARRLLARYALVRSGTYSLLRARARLSRPGPPPRVLVNSFPKAGSHLLTAALDQFPDLRPSWLHLAADVIEGDVQASYRDGQGQGEAIDPPKLRKTLQKPKSGQYLTSHLPAMPSLLGELAKLNYRIIFGYRDPRDIVVSVAYYVSTLPRHPQFRRFTEQLRTPEERMITTLRGAQADRWGPGFPPLGRRLWAYVPWLQAEHTISCRFEDLVGARGGGSDEAQLTAIRHIAEHVSRSLNETEALRIASNAWSPKTATFRTGQIRGWKSEFTPDVLDAFAEEVGDGLLLAYGYTPEA